VSVTVSGSAVDLGAEEVIVTSTPRSGWAVASDGGETVALEVTITPQLRREGYAREVVRLVQDARKGDGLEVSDRISLRWSTADPDLAWALTEYGELISGEVLAVGYGEGTGDDGSVEHSDADLGLTFWIRPA
jgi:isoleucyl-tRNA synthetase